MINEKYIRENWFKDHRIIFHETFESNLGKIETLRWQKPGTSIYMVDYVLKGATLFVSGDIGDAVYCWYGPNLSLKAISGMSIDYFHGKCQASEFGRSLKCYEWDESEAEKTVKEYFDNYSTPEKYQKFLELSPPLHDPFGLNCWAYYNDPSDILGDQDWYEWFPQCGEIYPARIRGHLIGLKMAFENDKTT